MADWQKVAVTFTIPVPGVHFFAIRRYRNLDGLDPVTWLQQSKLQAHITKRKYLRRMPQDSLSGSWSDDGVSQIVTRTHKHYHLVHLRHQPWPMSECWAKFTVLCPSTSPCLSITCCRAAIPPSCPHQSSQKSGSCQLRVQWHQQEDLPGSLTKTKLRSSTYLVEGPRCNDAESFGKWIQWFFERGPNSGSNWNRKKNKKHAMIMLLSDVFP